MRLLTNALRGHMRVIACLALLALLVPASLANAQATTGSITGTVKDAQKRPVAGATVVAIHLPSGSNYETVSREDGRFAIPNMRIGGPYQVVVSPGTGAGAVAFQVKTMDNVTVNLGVATDLSFDVQPVVKEEVTVVGQSDPVFAANRTGAATTVSRDMLASMPTVSGRLQDMTRVTPQYGGSLSFGGVDPRLNNIQVDGSYFNNSFGLRNSPGDTSGVAPISLAAIEQVQVNLAPYDVRQGNFVGAGINTVTRSGGNAFHGSFYNQSRNQSLAGDTARGTAVTVGTYTFRNTGGYVSGPIQRNKAFFFFNYENEALTQPGTTYRANTGTETVAGNVTRVLASDLDALSSYLQTNFKYSTGPYQGYDFSTPAKRYLIKGDYNLNDHNKIVVRYNQLDSYTDILVSNSSSLGNGNRRSSLFGLNFANSNYRQGEYIKSVVGEWNSVIGTNMANNMIVGWTYQNEDRVYVGSMFPFVDILKDNSTYTSFGFEPFTPNNKLQYKTFQVQDNFQEFTKNHTLTFGLAAERYNSINVFYPGSQSAYVYNSLADFYTDANDYLANPNRTTSPITLKRFQVRYNNIPGQTEPVQPLRVLYLSAYVQDDWRVTDRLTATLGLRWDVPYFGATGYDNVNADALTWRDASGAAAKYNTGKLPDANQLWSPRAGFNWDVTGKRTTQVRGGTGIFTGKPAYVWISNQVGNTGVLTGFSQLDNTTARPWNPNMDAYKPTNVTGAPATSTNLELIATNFKFPQVWRTNIAMDQKLPYGLESTVEFIYNQDVNGLSYANVNLPAATGAYTGADQRMFWVSTPSCNSPTVGPCANRINNATGSVITTAVVLGNQNVGRNWNFAASLEKKYKDGFWVKGAYSYGVAKNLIDPGSIATGSWTGNAMSNDPNNPTLGYSAYSPGHRFFVTGAYQRDFFRIGMTTVSLFWNSYTIGNSSYIFGADANNDGATSNDLIYIPRNTSEMNFYTYTTGGVTFTATDQAAAWEAYINQDKYLSAHRGEYAVRGAVFLPFVHRLDFSVQQDVTFKMGKTRHTVALRLDVDNFTNLLNSDWGVSTRIISTSPLINPKLDATTGALTYNLRAINGALMNQTYQRTASTADVYRMMFTIKYTF